MKEVACGIHASRYWHQAQDNDAKRANVALGFIARLSQIEQQLRKSYPYKNLQGERDFASVHKARQRFSLPILTEHKAWLDREIPDKRILAESPIRAAFNYTLNQWDALGRYTQQGFRSMETTLQGDLLNLRP